MSEPIKTLRHFLAKSPSVIYPEDVLEYLPAIEAENAKLRELARLLLWGVDNDMPRYEELAWTQKVNALVRELGVEVE